VIGAGLELIPQDSVPRNSRGVPSLVDETQFQECLCGVVRRKPATSYDNILRDNGYALCGKLHSSERGRSHRKCTLLPNKRMKGVA